MRVVTRTRGRRPAAAEAIIELAAMGGASGVAVHPALDVDQVVGRPV